MQMLALQPWPWIKRFLSFLSALFLAFFFVLQGCGGGGGGGVGSSESSESGDVLIGLTDNPGDFINYTADVVSLQLVKADGAIVETLPVTTRVDFAQYMDMTEFLTAATIPAGVYKRAILTLDYTHADIKVEGGSGETMNVTDIRDEEGNPVSTLQVSIHLEDRNTLRIRPGIPAHLSVDFDLSASNKVEFLPGDGARVSVSPVLLADVEPNNKIYRLRGPLKDVYPDRQTFDLYIRPFYHAMTGDHNHFGAMRVHVDGDTNYVIDGVQNHGQAGLTALDAKTGLTAVIVFGDFTAHPLRFVARDVYAGSSVPGGTLDVVTGNVTARTLDTINVRGAVLLRDESKMAFNRTIAITLGAGAKVTRQLSKETYTKNDISIGQRIMVFGTISNPASDDNFLMNNPDYIRMLFATLFGTVKTTNPTQPKLDMILTAVDLRKPDLFNFTNTGFDAAHAADPGNYQIDTSMLDISTLLPNAPIKVRGFVNTFQSAPPDFNAWTIVDVSKVRGIMHVTWSPESASIFNEISSANLQLDLNGVGDFHHINRAGVKIELTAPTGPVIQPYADGSGLYVINLGDNWTVYATFDDFAAALQTQLTSGSKVKHLWAMGLYDDATATLTSGYIDVRLLS